MVTDCSHMDCASAGCNVIVCSNVTQPADTVPNDVKLTTDAVLGTIALMVIVPMGM